VSHVLPFPGNSGQQQRVAYTLRAARELFEVHFVTFAPKTQTEECRQRLAAHCDRPIVLDSASVARTPARLLRWARATAFALRTGLKRSNFLIGRVELSADRILSAVQPRDYACALFEYFHAAESTRVFRSAGVPSVLDMHNILWKEREQRLSEARFIPEAVRTRRLARYKEAEESAWRKFDAVIAINRTEFEYVSEQVSRSLRVFYAPMGVDVSAWPCSWQSSTPPRVGFYGGMGSKHNQAAAMRCLNSILPALWTRFPDLEFWIIGSNPPESLLSLADGKRVRVTGYVPEVRKILSMMSLVLCPWSGKYGFRSRLVEVMALGVPVVATPAAVDGMELESGRGIILADTNEALAEAALKLLSDSNWLETQSRLARSEMERLYGLENTYGRLMTELREWLDQRRAMPRPLTTDH
jgi:glycosyltransferase involved in cell wall biosynthesis